MTGLILISIALTALIGVLCTLLFIQQSKLLKQILRQQDVLVNLDKTVSGLATSQESMRKRIDQLATDVLQREIYQNAGDRHQLAIQSAKQGRSVFELVRRHGLSTDEAELVVSLHAPKNLDSIIKNANLIDSATVELI